MDVESQFYSMVVRKDQYRQIHDGLAEVITEAHRLGRNVHSEDWVPVNDGLVSFIEKAENSGLIHPGQKVLELGSGTGTASLIFSNKGYNVVGIEIEPNLVNISAKSINQAHLKGFLNGNINIFQGSYYPDEYLRLRAEGKSKALRLESRFGKEDLQLLKMFPSSDGEDVYSKYNINSKEADMWYGYFWAVQIPSIMEFFELCARDDAKLIIFGNLAYVNNYFDKFNLKIEEQSHYNETATLFSKIKSKN